MKNFTLVVLHLKTDFFFGSDFFSYSTFKFLALKQLAIQQKK